MISKKLHALVWIWKCKDALNVGDLNIFMTVGSSFEDVYGEYITNMDINPIIFDALAFLYKVDHEKMLQIIAEHINIIPDYICSEDKTIAKFKCPDNVTEIGEGAFLDSSIENIDLNKVKIIGKWAFQNTNIKQLCLPDNIQSLGLKAFADCEKLNSMESKKYYWVPFDNSCPYIYEGQLFYGCNNLKDIKVPNKYFKNVIERSITSKAW